MTVEKAPNYTACTQEYLDYVKAMEPKNLTNTQQRFAQWLLENESEINKIGNLESVFIDVRYYLKHVKS